MKHGKVLFLILGLLASSCASFKNNIYIANSGSVENQDIENFNGNYSIFPDEHFGEFNPQIIAPKDYYNLVRFLLDENQETDSLMINSVARISVIDNNTLSINIIQGKSVTNKFLLKGKFNSNGYFNLQESDQNCIGIPYLFGGCYHKKLRIGLDNKKSLIVQVAELNKGALLFIFFRGYAYNMAFTYERIPKN